MLLYTTTLYPPTQPLHCSHMQSTVQWEYNGALLWQNLSPANISHCMVLSNQKPNSTWLKFRERKWLHCLIKLILRSCTGVVMHMTRIYQIRFLNRLGNIQLANSSQYMHSCTHHHELMLRTWQECQVLFTANMVWSINTKHTRDHWAYYLSCNFSSEGIMVWSIYMWVYLIPYIY